MKLREKEHDHIALNSGDEVKFDISPEFVTHAIGMLVKQYSDPEMAFIRETCSNAYDAHTAAGNEDKPFDIHIPSTFAPYIEIRDYGTGISKDFMLNRYVSVGDSTKRKSNTEIGGFGIGRLSFLIVTEQAAITSYFNGVKYSYTCCYNDRGILVILPTDERPTDEPNGLRLKFPVQVNRVEAFRQAAKNYFKRVTSTMPNFTGESLKITPTRYTHQDDGWGIREPDGTHDIFAIMGNIAYPIRTETLRYDTRFTEVNSVLNSRIDLFFDIGEVEPLPTRENLDMCEKTITALLDRLTKLKTDLLTRIETDVAKAKNTWQAERAYNSILSGMSDSMSSTMRGLELKFKNEVIKNNNWNFLSPTVTVAHKTATITAEDGTVTPKMIEVQTLKFFERSKASRNSLRATSWQRASDFVYAYHGDYLQFCFVYNDTGKGVRPTIDHNFPNSRTKVVLVEGTAQGWEDFMEQEIARGFNPKGFRLASKLLPKPKRKRTLSDAATMAYLPANSSMPSFIGIKSNTRTTSYGEHAGKERYFVLASNYQLTPQDHAKMQELRSYVKTGMLDPIDILVLNKNRQALMEDEDDWVHFSDYVHVDPVKVTEKRKLVIKTVYSALRYHKMFKLHSEHLSKSALTTSKHWYNGKESGYGRVPSWKGNLVSDNAAVQRASEELSYRIAVYGNFLETVKPDPQLGQLVRNVLGSSNYIRTDDMDDLCKAYQIDFAKLKDAATVISPAEQVILDMVSSQTYLVLQKLQYTSGFDFKKLKKELSNGN